MESAFIVTNSQRSADALTKLLGAFFVQKTAFALSGGEARRILIEKDFDFVIINAPLNDESGEALARQLSARGISQVVLIVKSEIFEMASSVCAADGVLTVAKPMNPEIFRQAISLARAMRARVQRLNTENLQLKQKIDNIRTNDRAKAILMSTLNMTENEAHRYIEKRAMDLRVAKQVVAKNIVEDYENGRED